MADLSGVDAALAPARSIGRYFGLVSGLTSMIPIAFTIALVLSGAPRHRPSVELLADRLSGVSVVALAGFVFTSLVLGLAVHPLQFALTQALEGYWGTSKATHRAMRRSARRHFDRWHALMEMNTVPKPEIAVIDTELSLLYAEPTTSLSTARARALLDRRVQLTLGTQEADRALARYPFHVSQVMPTRLGNVLRRFESESAEMIGLDAVTALPYAGLLADEGTRSYLDDQRSAMDLSVRLTLVWTLCTVLGIGFLLPYGVWLLVPIATYILVLLSYRGAVAAAMHYGAAITVLIVLTRERLYERLGMFLPGSSAEEHHQNGQLSAFLSGRRADVEFPAWAAATLARRSASRGPDLPPDVFVG